MRPGEVCSLKPEDIDRTNDVWLYSPANHKNEHHELARIIPIGPRAQETMLPYLLRAADELCFPNAAGNRHTCKNYGERITLACKKAGVPRWRPNQLRHAAATEIRREFDLETVRTVLGHTTVGMSETYADPDVKRAMEVARRIG